jgi:hypothetical protein
MTTTQIEGGYEIWSDLVSSTPHEPKNAWFFGDKHRGGHSFQYFMKEKMRSDQLAKVLANVLAERWAGAGMGFSEHSILQTLRRACRLAYRDEALGLPRENEWILAQFRWKETFEYRRVKQGREYEVWRGQDKLGHIQRQPLSGGPVWKFYGWNQPLSAQYETMEDAKKGVPFLFQEKDKAA